MRPHVSRTYAARLGLAALVFSLITMPVRAGVLAEATRVIYTQGDARQPLMVVNTNAYPVVVQTWVDRGEANPDVVAPFVSLPSVFHLPPKAVQGLRILLADAQTLPRDRESVFWLNLHEIPPTLNATASEPRDTLALAMNTQLKIFYRPADLPKPDVAAQLRFTLAHSDGRWFVQCDNPTPYHASFTSLTVVDGENLMPVQSEMDMMTPPFAQRRYVLGDRVPAGKVLRYMLVDDAGFPQLFEAAL